MVYAWTIRGIILVLSEVNTLLSHLWKYDIQYISDCNVIRYELGGSGSFPGRNVSFVNSKARLFLRLTQSYN